MAAKKTSASSKAKRPMTQAMLDEELAESFPASDPPAFVAGPRRVGPPRKTRAKKKPAKKKAGVKKTVAKKAAKKKAKKTTKRKA
ncbi:MAG: histone-like protein 2 [Alphaproteobacteria bacterium]|nr:histone-like protein 2 [Alphaproteobacteria bacterium]